MSETVLNQIENRVRRRVIELGQLFGERRAAAGLSLRATALEVGVPFVVLGRLENGKPCELVSMLAVLRWMDLPADWLYGDGGTPGVEVYQRGRDDLARQIRSLLDMGAS